MVSLLLILNSCVFKTLRHLKYFVTAIKCTLVVHTVIVVGTPTATTLVYNETARTLTCTSTGGPATTVTWRKSGAIIAINAMYQQTQVVTNTMTGTYETVLTNANSVTDVFDIYNCTIENVRGTSSVIAVTGEDVQHYGT